MLDLYIYGTLSDHNIPKTWNELSCNKTHKIVDMVQKQGLDFQESIDWWLVISGGMKLKPFVKW